VEDSTVVVQLIDFSWHHACNYLTLVDVERCLCKGDLRAHREGRGIVIDSIARAPFLLNLAKKRVVMGSHEWQSTIRESDCKQVLVHVNSAA
jgi:hypothetical protein